MEKLEKYRACITQLLEKYGKPTPNDPIETQIIADVKRDHYQLVHVGWQNKRRFYGCVLHMDIKDEKIWIQHDGTEIGMANELVDLGVPKSDIILAFHAPSKWPYTGFGVA